MTWISKQMRDIPQYSAAAGPASDRGAAFLLSACPVKAAGLEAGPSRRSLSAPVILFPLP